MKLSIAVKHGGGQREIALVARGETESFRSIVPCDELTAGEHLEILRDWLHAPWPPTIGDRLKEKENGGK